MNSAANFVFTSQTGHGLPREVLGVRWVLLVPDIFVSEFEQHMYSSDPRPDTGSLSQLESSHNPKPQPGHFDNSTTRRPRSLSFSCFSIANQETVSRSMALFLRIKALALQKRSLFVLFALVVRTAAILDVAMFCACRGCAVQDKGITLEEDRNS